MFISPKNMYTIESVFDPKNFSFVIVSFLKWKLYTVVASCMTDFWYLHAVFYLKNFVSFVLRFDFHIVSQGHSSITLQNLRPIGLTLTPNADSSPDWVNRLPYQSTSVSGSSSRTCHDVNNYGSQKFKASNFSASSLRIGSWKVIPTIWKLQIKADIGKLVFIHIFLLKMCRKFPYVKMVW